MRFCDCVLHYSISALLSKCGKWVLQRSGESWWSGEGEEGQSRAGHYLGNSLTPLPEHIPQLFALLFDEETVLYRARICKRLRSPGIDFKESIPPAYVAWRAGTSNRVVPARQAGNRFLGSLKGLQIRALYLSCDCSISAALPNNSKAKTC